MAKISYIRTSKDGTLLLLGIVGEGESARYTISDAVYSSIGRPAPHTLLGERELSVIKYADELYRAEKKALSLLSYADNNERTLKDKLVRAGFSHRVSSNVAKEMVGLGYIDEERQLRRLIIREANVNLSGFSKLLPKLAAKGYSVEQIRSVTSSLVKEGEIDFKANAKKLVEKRLPEGATYEEKKTLLYKNGYKI